MSREIQISLYDGSRTGTVTTGDSAYEIAYRDRNPDTGELHTTNTVYRLPRVASVELGTADDQGDRSFLQHPACAIYEGGQFIGNVEDFLGIPGHVTPDGAFSPAEFPGVLKTFRQLGWTMSSELNNLIDAQLGPQQN